VHFRVVRAGNAKPLQTPRGRAANAQQNPRSGQTPRSGLDDLAELETNSLGPVRAAYAALFAPLVDGVAAAPNLTAAESIASAYAAPADATEAFAETMAQVVFAAAMRGYVADPAVASAVGNAQSAPGWISRAWSAARRALGNAEPAEVEFAPLPFDEAEAFWAGKQLVADWADIGAATYVQAVTLGLKVAGITEATALEQIAAVLDAAIRGGSTVAEAAAELAERFGLEATHAMTIVRTNIQSAYAWGHYQQLTDPDVLAELPYWQFHVVEDSKTSSVCKPLAGKIYPAGDNIWNSMYPPNHYNCRTTVSALTAAQAEDEGIATGWPVDKKTGKTAIAAEGFKHNIGTVPLGDIYE